MRARRVVAVIDAAVLVAGLVAMGVHHTPRTAASSGSLESPSPAAGATATTVPHAPAAPKVDDRPTAVGLYALRPADPGATNLTRYRIVTLNAWEWGRIAALKQAHPETIVLVYKDMSSTRKYAVDKNGNDDALLPTGIGYAAASKAHPEWFLRDDRGKRVEWNGYSSHWWMDVGNPAYSAAWLAAVRDELHAHAWDGVVIDNAIIDPSVYLPDGRHLATYPTPESYRAATESFLNAVSPGLRSDGRRIVVNLGGASPPLDLYQRWAAITGGVMREHFARWGADGKGALIGGDEWQTQADQQAAAVGASAIFMALTYANVSDQPTLRYARASFLVGWDGNASSALFVTSPDPRADPWSPLWTADIGKPTEPKHSVGGAWIRSFTRGIVAVNPTGNPVPIDLGASYNDDAGHHVTALVLSAKSGAVFGSATR